ncbi:MAG TPA: hypothetical protein VFD32_07375, partial [Dehalococcoidia bacterium]|nr:hypothetical protein [Dehalococcoidia bacterium]
IGDLGLVGANVRVGDRVEEAVDVFIGGRLGENPAIARRVREGVLLADVPNVAGALLREPGRTSERESVPAGAAAASGAAKEHAA